VIDTLGGGMSWSPEAETAQACVTGIADPTRLLPPVPPASS
jgi:hypothetical protein